jgi:hypothetical protein
MQFYDIGHYTEAGDNHSDTGGCSPTTTRTLEPINIIVAYNSFNRDHISTAFLVMIVVKL